jgi:hypothetical protein
MVDMGLDFKAPPKANRKAWQILELLHVNGFHFQGCGCDVGFKPPRTISEIPKWLGRHGGKNERKRFLGENKQRAATARSSKVVIQGD